MVKKNNNYRLSIVTTFFIPLCCFGAEQFHAEIMLERNLEHQTYDLPVRRDFIFDPLDLLVWSRFDIVAKYIYAYYREMGFQTDWALRLYIEHQRVWGNFQEWDGHKQSPDDFLEAFNEIIDSIKWNGFNPRISKIRIDTRKIPCEGSHRIGASLLYKNKIVCYYDPKGIPPYATMSSSMFFRKYTKYVKGGLAEKYLDDMALYYAKLKRNTSIMLVFPVADGNHDEIRKILRMYGNILYEKYVRLTKNGQLLFIRELYEDASWLGSCEDHFAGAEQEVCQRFSSSENDGTMRVWLVEFNTSRQRINCQQTIQALFDGNKYAVYSSKNHQETMRLGRILFLANSIEFLNTAETNYVKLLDYCLYCFKKMMHKYNIDNDHVCLVDDTTHTNCRSCDYLKLHLISSSYAKVPAEYSNWLPFDCTNTTIPADEILFNPENHFYYKDVKLAKVIRIANYL